MTGLGPEGIPVEARIELGRARIPWSELRKLEPGAVVELDRLVGEPADLVAGGRVLARGELRVVDGRFAFRVTEVM